MKRNIYAILLSAIAISFGCKTNSTNLNIQVKDSETEYTYAAVYPAGKTEKLKKYIALELNNKLPIEQQVDTTVSLPGGEQFKLKATAGELNIQFNKRDNSAAGYIKMKKLTDGINKILSGK
ncbi:hypothetical protein [Pedobacter rhodius]|uniref:DUF3568 domain-containing protein n=1 Tax=Pedobacter rhodius TaxID=3004098 RepID=A0ABT4KXI8_9SPHI|nr:hypothetical protein [Pedobacter sp. SJ11]MCZ4223643.1 hypothetical protein [Pedobacter sp. SJ11]